MSRLLDDILFVDVRRALFRAAYDAADRCHAASAYARAREYGAMRSGAA